MSNQDFAYIVPCKTVDETTKAIVNALQKTYESRGANVPEIHIFTKGESDWLEKFKKDLSKPESVIFHLTDGGAFHKMAAAVSVAEKFKYVAFTTADDLTFYSPEDIQRSVDGGWAVTVGHFMLARPTRNKGFRIFRGWTHFSQYMGNAPGIERLITYIGEGPHTVWACYNAQYFRSVARMTTDLIDILENNELNIIEDCINLVNLMASDRHSRDSLSLRFMDGNYSARQDFVPSWVVYEQISMHEKLGRVCGSISAHLDRARALGVSTLEFGNDTIATLLKAHCNGYRAARSRKWREWIDVDFNPFLPPRLGVSQSRDPENPYLNVFDWHGDAEIREKFPLTCWLSDENIVRFIRSVPKDVWLNKSA